MEPKPDSPLVEGGQGRSGSDAISDARGCLVVLLAFGLVVAIGMWATSRPVPIHPEKVGR